MAPTPGRSATTGMPSALQVRRAPDARQLEQLRRVDRAAGEDDLAAFDALRPPALPLDVDGDGAPPSNTIPVTNVRVRTVRFFRPPDRLQVGLRRRQPAAAVDVAVERREALLAIAVDVLGQVVAGLLAGREERRNSGFVAGPRSRTSGPSWPRHGSSGAAARHVSIFLKYGRQWA